MISVPGEVHTWEGVPRGLFRQAMKGILPDAIALRRDKGDYSAMVNNSAKQDFEKMTQMLHPDCLGVQMGYFSRSPWRRNWELGERNPES